MTIKLHLQPFSTKPSNHVLLHERCLNQKSNYSLHTMSLQYHSVSAWNLGSQSYNKHKPSSSRLNIFTATYEIHLHMPQLTAQMLSFSYIHSFVSVIPHSINYITVCQLRSRSFLISLSFITLL